MPSADAPLWALVIRELRALCAGWPLWLLVIGAGPLAGLALTGALAAFKEGGTDAQAGVVVPVLSALFLSTTLGFPFVVAHVAGADRRNGAHACVWQLGHRALASAAAKALALAAAFVLSLLPALCVLGAFALAGGHVDVSATAALVAGYALYAGMVIGVGLFASSLVSDVALVTLAATAGLWALFVAGKLTRATPAAALRVFERGVVDVRLALVMGVVAVTLVLWAAQLAAPASSLEKRLLRVAVVSVLGFLALLVCAQVRRSFDFSEGHSSSFPRAIEEALGHIGDPVRVTLRLRADDPRSLELERAVLGPLARATGVDVERANDDKRYGLVTYQVGTRAGESRAMTAQEIVPLVLELAGLRAPIFVADARAPHPFTQPVPLAYALAFGVWPALGALGLWRARRRAG